MSCHAEQNQNLFKCLLYILCSGAAPSFEWVLNPTSKSLNYLHMKYEHLSVGRNYNKNIEKCYYKKLKQQIGKFVFPINLIILQTSPPHPLHQDIWKPFLCRSKTFVLRPTERGGGAGGQFVPGPSE